MTDSYINFKECNKEYIAPLHTLYYQLMFFFLSFKSIFTSNKNPSDQKKEERSLILYSLIL